MLKHYENTRQHYEYNKALGKEQIEDLVKSYYKKP